MAPVPSDQGLSPESCTPAAYSSLTLSTNLQTSHESEFPLKEMTPEATEHLYILIIYSHKAGNDADLDKDSDPVKS